MQTLLAIFKHLAAAFAFLTFLFDCARHTNTVLAFGRYFL